MVQFCANAVTAPEDTFEPRPYWINTSGIDVITLYLERARAEDVRAEMTKMEELLNGTPQLIALRVFETYPDIGKSGLDFDAFMTLLLYTGYVTFTDDSALRGSVRLRIPNDEVLESFKRKLQVLYGHGNPVWVRKARFLLEYFLHNEWERARDILDEMLGAFISIRDTGAEALYHGVLLAILSLVTDSHVEISSEPEGGEGYADITLYSKKLKTAVILELKRSANDYNARMKASEDAAGQIIRKNSVKGFLKMHCSQIYGMGIGFGGKMCEIRSLGNLLGL